MLELRRLRLLRELHERGTIAAVADALRFTPSAVSQQLAALEREAGVTLLERAGRGVRLTDAALVLVGHAEALLERADGARKRWLRDVQRLGRAAEMQPLGDGHEIPQLPQFRQIHTDRVLQLCANSIGRCSCAGAHSRPQRGNLHSRL